MVILNLGRFICYLLLGISDLISSKNANNSEIVYTVDGGRDFSNFTNEEILKEYEKFALKEDPKDKSSGRFGPKRPIRDPESGLEENGRLKISLTGRQNINQGLVPLAMRDEIYRLHMSDPTGKGSLARLARKTGLRVMKIQGIIKLRGIELDVEKKQGHPLDQTIDKAARIYFGEKNNWKGEFDEQERLARVSLLCKGTWECALDGKGRKVRKMSEASSLGGFYKPWPKKVVYNGEKVFKDDGRYVFMWVGKSQKKRRALI